MTMTDEIYSVSALDITAGLTSALVTDVKKISKMKRWCHIVKLKSKLCWIQFQWCRE